MIDLKQTDDLNHSRVTASISKVGLMLFEGTTLKETLGNDAFDLAIGLLQLQKPPARLKTARKAARQYFSVIFHFNS